MKVLLVGPYSRPSGGVQVHLVQLARFLERKGHTCLIINLGKNKHLNSGKVVSPKNALEVALVLFKKRDHICHLHFGGNLHTRLLLLALISSLLFQKRCAATIHSGGFSVWGQPKSPLVRLLFRLSFALSGTIICVNPKIGDHFQRLGINPQKIQIIPAFSFGDDLNGSPLPEPIDSFIKGKKPLLCNIGLLEPEYDLGLLLRVFRRFIIKNPAAGLIMVGSGSLHGALEKLISEMQLQGKVMLTGDVSHSNTLKILASSDRYIRGSRYDGDCISLKEAIHLGIPVIATDTGMRPPQAILFPIGDEDGLLKNLEKINTAPARKGNNFNESEFSSLARVEEVLSQLN